MAGDTTTTTTAVFQDPHNLGAFFFLLPVEILQHLSRFLTPHEVIHWSLSCPSIRKLLNVRPFDERRRYVEDLTYHGTSVGDFLFPTNIRVPVPIQPERIHSTTLKICWNDQGQFEQKGKIWIVGWKQPTMNPNHKKEEEEEEEEEEESAQQPQPQPQRVGRMPGANYCPASQRVFVPTIEYLRAKYGARIAAASSLAPQKQGSTELYFVPERGYTYNVWAVVGGPGYMLRMETISIRYVVFDTPQNTWSSKYNHWKRLFEQDETTAVVRTHASPFLEKAEDLEHERYQVNPEAYQLTKALLERTEASLQTMEDIIIRKPRDTFVGRPHCQTHYPREDYDFVSVAQRDESQKEADDEHKHEHSHERAWRMFLAIEPNYEFVMDYVTASQNNHPNAPFCRHDNLETKACERRVANVLFERTQTSLHILKDILQREMDSFAWHQKDYDSAVAARTAAKQIERERQREDYHAMAWRQFRYAEPYTEPIHFGEWEPHRTPRSRLGCFWRYMFWWRQNNNR